MGILGIHVNGAMKLALMAEALALVRNPKVEYAVGWVLSEHARVFGLRNVDEDSSGSMRTFQKKPRRPVKVSPLGQQSISQNRGLLNIYPRPLHAIIVWK